MHPDYSGLFEYPITSKYFLNSLDSMFIIKMYHVL